jgi:hypothetical protein
MSKLSAIALLALLLTAFNPPSAKAQCFNSCVIPPPPRAVPVVGPWVVGAFGLSTLSVIIRAAVVSHNRHRELTSKEAADAILIPFVWILSLQDADKDDVKSIIADVKAINNQKAQQRDLLSPMQRLNAPSSHPDLTTKRP